MNKYIRTCFYIDGNKLYFIWKLFNTKSFGQHKCNLCNKYADEYIVFTKKDFIHNKRKIESDILEDKEEKDNDEVINYQTKRNYYCEHCFLFISANEWNDIYNNFKKENKFKKTKCEICNTKTNEYISLNINKMKTRSICIDCWDDPNFYNHINELKQWETIKRYQELFYGYDFYNKTYLFEYKCICSSPECNTNCRCYCHWDCFCKKNCKETTCQCKCHTK